MLCNSSSSLLYTDLTAPAPTAHRPSYYTTIRTNHSTLSRPVALRTLIWCRSSRGKIGLPGWKMICHNRPQSREIHFVFQPFSERTRYASHYIHGLLQTSFPPWAEVKSMLPEPHSLWHHRNNLSIDDNGTLWRKRSSQRALLQLLVPKAGREQLFLSYHASLYGGHLGRTRTLARLSDRFCWSGMSDDVKDWLSQCVACIKGSHQWAAIIRWAIFPPVIAGIVSPWTFWTSVILHWRDSIIFW